MNGPKLLLAYLDANKINRSDFATRAQMSRQLVSLYVNGKRRPTIPNAVKIERATGGAVPVSAWDNEAKVA